MLKKFWYLFLVLLIEGSSLMAVELLGAKLLSLVGVISSVKLLAQKKYVSFLVVVFLLITLGSSTQLFGQTNTWDGSSSNNWNTAANWSLNAVPTAAHDVVINSNAPILVNTTTTINSLTINNSATVSFTSSGGGRIITIDNTGSSIAFGSSLTLQGSTGSGTRSMSIVFTGTNRTMSIAGTLTLTAVGEGTIYNATNSLTTVTGTLINDGTGGGTVGNITSIASNLIFSSGGTYKHALNSGIIPTATWNASSTCSVTGIAGTALTGLNQTFENFKWNCTGQTVTQNFPNATTMTVAGTLEINSTGSGLLQQNQTLLSVANFIQTGGSFWIATSTARTLTVTGDVSISGGTLTMSSGSGVGTMNVGGNFSFTAGTITESSTGSGSIVFNKSGIQTYTSGGTISNAINFTVNSGSALQMAAAGTTVTGGGIFTLAAGAILGVTSTEGITTSGATGNIQVTGTRTYSSGANYTYDGIAAQVTGNGLTQNTPANLTINNSAGVTLSAATTISGLLTMTSGTLDMANFNLSVGSLTGSSNLTGTSGARSLTIGTDGTSPAAYSGVISNGTATSVAVTKSGTGTLTLSGNNSYTGATTIGAGTLKVGLAGGTIPDASAVMDNGILDLAGNNEIIGSLAGSGTVTSSVAGTIALTAGGNNSNTTFSGIIQNGTGTAVGLTKTGSGILTLSGVNTYSGATTISAGTLKLGNNAALGTSAGGVSITSGAVLDLNGINYATAEALTVNGTGISSGGAVINSSATGATYAGLLTLGSASSIMGGTGTIAISNAGTITGSGFGFTLGGAQGGTLASTLGTGTGTLTKIDTGTWTLSGASTFTGGLTINSGTIQLGAADRLSNSLPITPNGGTFRTGATTGFADVVGTLALTDNSTIVLGTGTHSLTFAASNGVSWTSGKTLTVTGWTGGYNGTSGTAGKIYVGSNASGLIAGQLAQIRFYSGSAYYPATIRSDGEVVPTGNYITTGTITGSPFCTDATGINVPFTYGLASNFPSATFTAQLSDALGSFTSPVTLQSVASDASGSQSISITIPSNTTAGTGYRIRVVSNTPAVTGSDNGTDLTVDPLPTATYTLSASPSTIYNGSSSTLSLSGSQTGVNYQLRIVTTPVGSAVAGTGSAISFAPVSPSSTTTYNVLATNATTGCSVQQTSTATVTVLPACITGQPSNVTICSGAGTSFSVVASGSPSYQWQVSTDNGGSWNNITAAGTEPVYAGWTTSTLSLTGTVPSNNAFQYRCVLSGGCGQTSNAATLTLQIINISYTLSAIPGLISVSESSTLTLSGSQSNVNYQLRTGTTPIGSPVAGTGSSISFATVNPSVSTQYNVLATTSTGGCSAQITDTRTVIVNETGIIIDLTTCNGQPGLNFFTNSEFGTIVTNNYQTPDQMKFPGVILGYPLGGYTNYTYGLVNDAIPDGNYVIANSTAGMYRTPQQVMGTDVWLYTEDRSSSPGSGHMYIVNASNTPGEFYTETLSDLCENTRYEFRAEMINLYDSILVPKGSGYLSYFPIDGQGYRYSILPNVDFMLDGSIALNTGNIMNDGAWKTYGFTFRTAPGQTSVTLTMRNNSTGGIGNDIALDNIIMRSCGPVIDITIQTTLPVCPGEPVTMTAVLIAT